jgi:hypothetical protein
MSGVWYSIFVANGCVAIAIALFAPSAAAGLLCVLNAWAAWTSLQMADEARYF